MTQITVKQWRHALRFDEVVREVEPRRVALAQRTRNRPGNRAQRRAPARVHLDLQKGFRMGTPKPS